MNRPILKPLIFPLISLFLFALTGCSTGLNRVAEEPGTVVAAEAPADEAPLVEASAVVAPPAEASAAEAAAAEAPPAEAPAVEAPAPAAVETPISAAEAPAVEAPAAETHVPPAVEAPAPAVEVPAVEAPPLAGAAGKSKDIPEKEVEEPRAPLGIQEQLEELRQEVRKMRKEADARKTLEVSEEEKGKQAEDILSAAGTEYTLLKKGAFGLEYSFNYSYFSGDVIKNAAIVEKRTNHNLINLIFAEYGLRDNLTLNASIPFVYKYNKVGTDKPQDTTDLGDISLGVQMQPFKANANIPATILSAGLTLPSGSSPYEITPDEALSSGSGFYSINAGVNLSKTMDPLVAYGNFVYTYNFEDGGLNQNWRDGRKLTRVDPGSNFNFAFGFGYALSYKVSLNISSQIAYNLSNEYHFSNAQTYKSGSYVSSTFNIGTGWRVTPGRTIYVKLGIGLTEADPDFNFSIRVPFEF